MTINAHESLAEEFETHRAHLRAVAYRILGSRSDGDDAVQEAWLRLSRADTHEVHNLGGWLTTVVGRICLDMLRSRKARGEELLGARLPDSIMNGATVLDRDNEEHLADAMGPALVVVLETLAPAERLAFVLHDMFAVPFDDIAPIVGRSTIATRQLASRARRRVQDADVAPEPDRAHRTMIDAFLAASRAGDFEALLELLAPDVVVRADHAAVLAGAVREVRGAAAVADIFKGRARVAQPARVDGSAGAIWTSGSTPRVVFEFTIAQRKIMAIDLIADAEVIAAMELSF
jgi:RNA polymerase sigma-70 factor, ECF subfamily